MSFQRSHHHHQQQQHLLPQQLTTPLQQANASFNHIITPIEQLTSSNSSLQQHRTDIDSYQQSSAMMAQSQLQPYMMGYPHYQQHAVTLPQQQLLSATPQLAPWLQTQVVNSRECP